VKELRQVVQHLVGTLGFSEHQYIAVRLLHRKTRSRDRSEQEREL
jgi:hypothetical protein